MDFRKVKAGLYVNDKHMVTIEKSGHSLWVVYNIDDSIVCDGRTLKDAVEAATVLFEMSVEDTIAMAQESIDKCDKLLAQCDELKADIQATLDSEEDSDKARTYIENMVGLNNTAHLLTWEDVKAMNFDWYDVCMGFYFVKPVNGSVVYKKDATPAPKHYTSLVDLLLDVVDGKAKVTVLDTEGNNCMAMCADAVKHMVQLARATINCNSDDTSVYKIHWLEGGESSIKVEVV